MSKIGTVINILKNEGLRPLLNTVRERLLQKRVPHFKTIKEALKDKCGLEIGGPSWNFKDYNPIPIYRVIKNLDSCNFSGTTIWEGNIQEGTPFNFYKNKAGLQYIGEATNLFFIPDSKYDFIISSHCLEHIANPLKAIEEWLRVIKNDGYILIVVPNKEVTFDHKRNVTKFSHLIQDYNNCTKENDFTHLDEILELHDLKMDVKAGTFDQFKARSLNNSEVRALHHHVFDISLLEEIFAHFNIKTLLAFSEVDHVIFGRKNKVNI